MPDRNLYLVSPDIADGTTLLGWTVRPGQALWLTEGEAATPLELGQIHRPSAERDPLDHDGDGRKGGSLPKPRRRPRS